MSMSFVHKTGIRECIYIYEWNNILREKGGGIGMKGEKEKGMGKGKARKRESVNKMKNPCSKGATVNLWHFTMVYTFSR